MKQLATRLLLGVMLALAVVQPLQAADGPRVGIPQGIPTNAASIFDPALRCMDELLSRSTIGGGFYLVPSGLDDPSGKMGVTRDMVIRAAMRMSERSHFFRVVLDPRQLPPGTAVFQPRGSVFAFDQEVQSNEKGGSGSIGQVVSGTQRRRSSITSLSIALSLANQAEEILPGTRHDGKLLLRSNSKSSFLLGLLRIVGASYDLSSFNAEGLQAGTQVLIDLMMIQAVGNLAQVPYTRCLADPATDPRNDAVAWQTFEKLKPAGQEQAIRDAMVSKHLVPASYTPGQMRQAIADFERSRHMVPSGTFSFEVWKALGAGDAKNGDAAPNHAIGPAVKVSPVGAAFQYETGATYPKVYAGDRMAFEVTVARPAYVACYYTDAQHRVTRLYPNPTAPARRLEIGDALRLPSDQDDFVLKPSRSGSGEWVTCMASPESITDKLSSAVPDQALQPLPGITTARELIDRARLIDPNLSIDTLSIHVQ